MAVSTRDLPDTMVSPETGETLRRGVRPFVVTYKGRSKTVELPGYYLENSDEGIHVGNDMAASDAALRALKEEVEGIPSPATIKRVRRKLKLSQREAGGLCKVGENAFDKYDRGLVEPSGPTSQLLRILYHHPELIKELRQGAALSLMMLAWSNLLCTQREHSTRYATPDARPAAVDPYLPFRMKRATTRVDPIRTL